MPPLWLAIDLIVLIGIGLLALYFASRPKGPQPRPPRNPQRRKAGW